MTIRASLLGAVAALVFAAPAAAQDFIIVNATLVIGDGSEPFEDGVVVVERGRVTYAGPAAGLAEWIREFTDAGAQHLICRFAGDHDRHLDECLDALRDVC